MIEEKFKKTFDKLHASPELLKEVISMTEEKKNVPFRKGKLASKAVAAAIALTAICGTGGAAYAMDIGGIQRKLQVWIEGDITDATLKVENGAYTLSYKDKDGKDASKYGGGVALNEDGSERALTAEELLTDINSPEVVYEKDGSIFVYYKNQKLDITDKFKNDICNVKLEMDGKTMYMTIKHKSGYVMSPHGYESPDIFNKHH